MILEEETFKKFGYYSKDLKSKSAKKILVKCGKCGKMREVCRYGYRDLCGSCAQKEKHVSEEHKHKISDACKERFKNPQNHPMFGNFHTKETKQKISSSRKGKYQSEETKEKISEAHIGKHFSEEHKQRLSEAHRGKHFSEEHKRKLGEAYSGKNNPMWKGDISFEPYCFLFDEEFKERVREFWNRRCVICKGNERELGQKLDVHHVNYNKDTCCDDSVPLFVPLCRSCHMKMNFNREFWEDKFKQIIYSCNIDGKCYHTKEK